MAALTVATAAFVGICTLLGWDDALVYIDSPLIFVAFVLLGVVALGVSVPASPGYFGVIQGCFIAVLSGLSDQQEAVFAASVYYHLANYIPVTLLGLYYFNRSGLTLHEVTAAREEAEPQS